MYAEDEMLPLSALQHLEFCPRRCALVHVEGLWTENTQTAEGRVLHRRVHESPSEMVGGIRIVRGLRLFSRKLGLFGVADVVEFHPVDDPTIAGVILPNLTGRWRPFPVEYKRGRRKPEISYLVQLCAQALCLEEITNAEVRRGALYHGQSRRRQEVAFDDTLRGRTRQRAIELHELLARGHTPPPEPGPKCRFCSLVGKCLPKLSRSRSAQDYVRRAIESLLAEPLGGDIRQ
jgi:CRISPR-associated exonuclease Cas4